MVTPTNLPVYLVKGDDCFFAATGVTDGDVLQGVRYQGARSATTESLVMRSRSGTVRRISARHDRTNHRLQNIGRAFDVLEHAIGARCRWDQLTDANKGKTAELGVTLNPIKPLSITGG